MHYGVVGEQEILDVYAARFADAERVARRICDADAPDAVQDAVLSLLAKRNALPGFGPGLFIRKVQRRALNLRASSWRRHLALMDVSDLEVTERARFDELGWQPETSDPEAWGTNAPGAFSHKRVRQEAMA